MTNLAEGNASVTGKHALWSFEEKKPILWPNTSLSWAPEPSWGHTALPRGCVITVSLLIDKRGSGGGRPHTRRPHPLPLQPGGTQCC